MLRKMYAIRDAAVKAYHNPISQLTHEEAIRSFKGAVNAKDTPYNQHPEDYDLYYLGDFDSNTGKIFTPESPTHISKAIDHVVRTESAPLNVVPQ